MRSSACLPSSSSLSSSSSSLAVLSRKPRSEHEFNEALQSVACLGAKGARVSAQSVYPLLEWCIHHKNLCAGSQVHALIHNCGLASDAFLHSHLIRFYAACEKFTEACYTFCSLQSPSVYSWSAMILSSVMLGECTHAITLYCKMVQLEVEPDGHTFVAVLKACTHLKDLSYGHCVNSDIVACSLECDVFIGSALVDMYVKCDDLEDARRVFDGLDMHSVVSWSALIFGYSEHGQFEEAFKLFQQMQLEGMIPNRVTYVCILKACSAIEALSVGTYMHTVIIGAGFDSDMFVGSILIDTYASLGRLDYAHRVFKNLQKRDAVAWNAMIAANIQHCCMDGALQLYNQMQQEGLEPTSVSLVCIFKACAIIPAVDEGKRIHARYAGGNFESDHFVGNALLNMYLKCAELETACRLFEKLKHRSVVTWTTMLAGYAQNGHSSRAFGVYEQMKENNIVPHSATFFSILKACSILEGLPNGRLIHSEIVESGFESDIAVASSLIDMYVKCESFQDAQQVFDQLETRDIVTWNAIIAGYAQNGYCEKALWLFCRMQDENVKPDRVTENVMIRGFATHEYGLEALQVFQYMQHQGIEVDATTFASALKACAVDLLLYQGKLIHANVIESGFEVDATVSQALLGMYIKCGSLQDALIYFDRHERPSTMIWNTLISDYSQSEHDQRSPKLLDHLQFFVPLVDAAPVCPDIEDTVQLVYRMVKGDIAPDKATILLLLKSFSSAAALNQAKYIHTCILESELEQDISICNLLIGTYGSYGSLKDAYQVFIKLKEPTVSTWNAIITACAQNSKLDLATTTFDAMQKLELMPDSVTFLSLLSACSHVGNISKGFYFLNLMTTKHLVNPMYDHYTCIIDLLGRTGYLKEAEDLLRSLPFASTLMGWTSLMSHCTVHGSLDLGSQCFDLALQNESRHASNYASMSGIYVQHGIDEGADKVDGMKECANAWKKPGRAFIEVDTDVHAFSVQDKACPQSIMVCMTLKKLTKYMKCEGYLPNLDIVLTVPFERSLG